MNNENLTFLLGHLRYLGCGGDAVLFESLEQALRLQKTEFTLTTRQTYEDESVLEITFHFCLGFNEQFVSMYRYDASLTYQADPERNKQHSFFRQDGVVISCREAFNLLQGRAVYKKVTTMEGGKYEAWLQLDFTTKIAGNYKVQQFRAGYGYRLETVLSSYPIQEWDDPALKEALLLSLKKGNLHPITLVKPLKTEKMFITANPRFKTVNLLPLDNPRKKPPALLPAKTIKPRLKE